MRKIFSCFIISILVFCLLSGCRNTNTSSNNSSAIDSAEQLDHNQLYTQFLNGAITAKDSDGSLKYIDEYAIYGKLPQDYRYTFFDVNFDGEKELCVGEYKYILCFNFFDGEINYYETLTYTKFLTNGGVLYDFSSVEYHQCIYKDFELEVNFEHHTDYSENTEEFYIGAALVSKDEYDKRLGEYLSIPEVDWYDRYGNVVKSLPEVHDKMLFIMRNEETYINESGNSIYISESASDSYIDDLIARPKEFAYFDVDHDGEREMVIGITFGGEYVDHYVILDHESDCNIYGHLLGIRSLQMLKEDGTFNQSGGAGTNRIACLKLDKTEIEFIVLAENLDTDGIYKIDGKDVSKEEMDTYYDQFNAKQDCYWTDAEDFVEQ